MEWIISLPIQNNPRLCLAHPPGTLLYPEHPPSLQTVSEARIKMTPPERWGNGREIGGFYICPERINDLPPQRKFFIHNLAIFSALMPDIH
ncbi:hypothetical protein KDD30_16515 [Photobacterium sp. GJ3]|uniref:hypothetical protein n=1 Tax=Photobacterium sp. GJ3 TaxID=2829502 RepID=UPI001B8C23A0|nr:hypothetical protein [Photobacterium sp. GJ3]QUJ67582.1 hypothetical protein KDD30_16515 [Photobacterium sp. GJ3]